MSGATALSNHSGILSLREVHTDERVPWSTLELTLLEMRDHLNRELSLHGDGGMVLLNVRL